MRHYLGIIIIGLVVFAVLIALSAAGSTELDRPRENELQPIRSSYNTGPTGTRAFYQLLEESGRRVARLRESYHTFEKRATNVLLIIIGPFQNDRPLPPAEASALQKWIMTGGHALIVSRDPLQQFGGHDIHSEIANQNPEWAAPAEKLIDSNSDGFVVQPTELTRDLRGLALSNLAARMKFSPSEQGRPRAPATQSPTPLPPKEGELPLYAPVIHLGDGKGAILADFKYGRGRVVFLSDPFVIANNGISRGSNLRLALNLVNSLSTEDRTRTILFDEFHHGFQSENNPLVNYFRGTPMPWLLGQALLVGLLLAYTYGRRFARPLPLPRADRHSPLEFVGSMANLQRVAQARELAIENIYPRFRSKVCRRLGLTARAPVDEIISTLRLAHLPLSEVEVSQVLSDGERVLKGEQIDDLQLVSIVTRMRRILAQLKDRI
jgi:Domain of unknown function (DUF4350)